VLKSKERKGEEGLLARKCQADNEAGNLLKHLAARLKFSWLIA
jgi:hypothetical protein